MYKAKTCVFGRYECRNTAKYNSVGQNIAIIQTTHDLDKISEDIDDMFGWWFDENKDCDMTYITNYRYNPA